MAMAGKFLVHYQYVTVRQYGVESSGALPAKKPELMSTISKPIPPPFRTARWRRERDSNAESLCAITLIVATNRAAHSVMMAIPNLLNNFLLAAFPKGSWERIRSEIRDVRLPLGQAIYEPGSTVRHVYFPTTAMISLTCGTSDGESAQIAVVGNEGMVGVTLLLGGETTSSRAVVTGAGHAFTLPAEAIKKEFASCGEIRHLLLRYTQALSTQVSQTAACNRHHTLDQQLCRWLLMCLDRAQDNNLVMTHELISNLLGVRREGITDSARKMQAVGLIRYRRGHISVLDREGLEQLSCECYAVVKHEYDRLLVCSPDS